MNWYRTRRVNFDEELALGDASVKVPTLYIAATKDAALSPALSQGMESAVPHLTRAEVNSSHWALVQAAPEVNRLLREWFGAVVFGGKSVL